MSNRSRALALLLLSVGSAFADATNETAPPPRPVTLALVGCAHMHVKDFIQILQARPDAKIKYVWDHDPARAAKYAPELTATVPGNLDQLWADPAVTGVIIASETVRHKDLVLAAAAAHKHIFIEKPFATTAADAAAMADAIDKAGVKFSIGYFNRSLPAHLFIKEQIAAGTFGTITRAYAATAHAGLLEGWFAGESQWMLDPQQAGGGALAELGTHSLDLLMWLLGDITAVTADHNPTDTAGTALLQFKNGASATLAAGYVDPANPVTLMIAGTAGNVVIFDNHLYFTCPNVPGADGRKFWTKLPRPQPHPLLLFVDALAGKTDVPLITAHEAAARVRVMTAIYQAAKDKTWVTLK